MSIVASGKIAPAELVETLIQRDPRLGDELLGALTLIVRAPDDDGSFLADLVACVLRDAPAVADSSGVLNTAEFPTVPVKDSEPSDEDQVELLSELGSAPHCIVPLRGSGRSLQLGRAPQCEIVLNDPSVSAKHAVLLLDGGGVRVSDEGSKNGTMVNGRRLEPGEAPWLQPMDRVDLGRIQAFICAPRALRGVLRQDLRTLL